MSHPTRQETIVTLGVAQLLKTAVHVSPEHESGLFPNKSAAFFAQQTHTNAAKQICWFSHLTRRAAP